MARLGQGCPAFLLLTIISMINDEVMIISKGNFMLHVFEYIFI
jgi:hypothetical protein